MGNTVALKDWAKQISKVLFDCATAPAGGSAKPFPWKDLSAVLGKTFEEKDISVSLTSMRWAEPSEFHKGMGRKPQVQALRFSPLPGAAFWLIAQGELRSLMGWLVTKENAQLKLPEPELEEAFYTFLCLEALHALNELKFFRKVTPSLSEEEPLPREAGLLIDVSLKVGPHKIATRLILDPELHKAWSKSSAAGDDELQMSDELAESLEAVLHLEMGKTRLSFDEWAEVSTGDCLLLDQSTWKGDGAPCPVTLTVKGMPLFTGLVENGRLTIKDRVQLEQV